MMRLTALIAAATAAVPAMAADQVPSCDLFRERFAEAPQVLSLQLPNSKLYREPSGRIDKRDVWKTRAIRADGGKLWYRTALYCYGPKFDYVASDIDPPERPAHLTFDLIAANIYAFTGWEADEVVRAANEVVTNRSTVTGGIKNTELWPGAYTEIDQVGFSIFLEKQRQ